MNKYDKEGRLIANKQYNNPEFLKETAPTPSIGDFLIISKKKVEKCKK
jgi:hypothetical protein